MWVSWWGARVAPEERIASGSGGIEWAAAPYDRLSSARSSGSDQGHLAGSVDGGLPSICVGGMRAAR